MVLLVAELALLSSASLILIFQFPLFSVFLWNVADGEYLTYIAVDLLTLLIAGLISHKQLGPDNLSSDPPLHRLLSADPAFHELVEDMARRLGKSTPQISLISLSPTPWHQFGVDLQRVRRTERAIPLSISCLGILSVSELQAHVARTLIAHRGQSWLFTAVRRAIERLGAEQYQAKANFVDGWIIRARGRALQKYIDTVSVWQFLVDLEADMRVAQTIGSESVISLAYKEELANGLTPSFITEVVEPALDEHVILPVARSYAAHATVIDPHWRDAVSGALKDILDSPTVEYGALAARLVVLSNLPSAFAVHDPRPAFGMFTDLGQLEREAVINEFGLQRVEPAVAVSMSDWASLVVVPQLRSEVQRNETLLRGMTRFNIPELLHIESELAANYRTNPKILLTQAQSQERIPYLLGALLALELIDEHWVVSHAFDDGIRLRSGHRQIRPFDLVEQLHAGELSDEEFQQVVERTGNWREPPNG